ncbi:hypothetical protein AVEN_178727-1 [Araneus ventricosus]|uniref:Uncharacterized protein n=1 Tax=Araneus ventricosus TaxID=182803 RepID=A0A4Y2WUD9_ARAVE|nr:hypothetical protein AVEN_137559-1 [Araneus ventricosus]GBO41183.1 hypothetical protein AVEN_178727-1 [Araneus ventricosus]
MKIPEANGFEKRPNFHNLTLKRPIWEPCSNSKANTVKHRLNASHLYVISSNSRSILNLCLDKVLRLYDSKEAKLHLFDAKEAKLHLYDGKEAKLHLYDAKEAKLRLYVVAPF